MLKKYTITLAIAATAIQWIANTLPAVAIDRALITASVLKKSTSEKKVLFDDQEAKTLDSVLTIKRESTRFDVTINGVHGDGEEFVLMVPPTSSLFDTLFIRSISGPPGKWGKRICKINTLMQCGFGVNPCCGGIMIWPQIPGPVFFRLTRTDGKLYLGRFGESGVMLRNNTTLCITNRCDVKRSAMANQDFRISIESIDTGDDIRNNYDEFLKNQEWGDGNDDNDPYPAEYETLICYSDVNYADSEEEYIYLKKQTMYTLQYLWFSSRPILIKFDAKTKKSTLKWAD